MSSLDRYFDRALRRGDYVEQPDRFDRMLALRAAPPPAPVARIQLQARPAVVERQPVITSTRGPRWVDHMTCPMCGSEDVGIAYQGELMSGAKVHTLGAHSPGMRSVKHGMPRCLGAGMRVVFEGGEWKGEPRP